MKKLKKLLPSITLLVVILLVWEFVVDFFDVPLLTLPAPSLVFLQFIQDGVSSHFWYNIWITTQETVLGFIFAVVMGSFLAFIVGNIKILEKMLVPFIVALQSMPKIALAPLIIIWLGFGLSSKVVVAALVAFFPVFVNIYTGIRNIDRRQLDLLRVLRASRIQILTKVMLPATLTYLFASLEVAVIFSLLGTIVAEFIGSSYGLGSLLIQRQALVDIAGVFSILIYLSLLGTLLHGGIITIRNYFMPWNKSESDM